MEVEIDLPKEEEALVEVQPEAAPVVSFVHIIDKAHGLRLIIVICIMYTFPILNRHLLLSLFIIMLALFYKVSPHL